MAWIHKNHRALWLSKHKIPVNIGIVVAVLVIDIAVAVMFWYTCKTLIKGRLGMGVFEWSAWAFVVVLILIPPKYDPAIQLREWLYRKWNRL